MHYTITTNQRQETELEQILNELIYSLKKTYSEEDLLHFSYIIFKESGKQTYNSKKDTSIKIFKSILRGSEKAYSFGKRKFLSYKQNDLKKEFMKDLDYTKSALFNAPEKIKLFGVKIKNKALNLNDNFLNKTKEEKIELISVAFMGLLIFYASAGGEDFEGGIPDSDLNIGIGVHRHFLSHSIITGFIVEFLMRSGVEILNNTYKNLPNKHHAFWDKSNYHINKHKGIAIGAMWAGISAHLLKDSGILGHGFKPYTGIPIELSSTTHQGLFAANSTASAIFAYSDMKESKV